MRLAVAAVLAVFLAGTGALAYVRSGPGVMPHGHHRLRAPTAASPPLTGLTAASGGYGFRLLRTAYLGSPVARIRRASDALETDVGTAGDGLNWDNASALAHCAATSCFVVTLYDQSGNGRHLTQATPASQPNLVFDCVGGGRACLEFTAAGQLSLASFTPASGLVSIGVVANRTAGLGNCTWFREDGNVNRLISRALADQWTVSGSAGTLNVAALDVTWNAGAVVINGASTVANINGTETTGAVTGGVAAGIAGFLGVAGSTCRQAEAIFWDNYALTPAERSTLVANQRSFWGI